MARVCVHPIPYHLVKSATKWTVGATFSHRRAVQQGDPLSPMLVILAMDPLQRLLDMAT
jgi:hypothetical protein